MSRRPDVERDKSRVNQIDISPVCPATVFGLVHD